MGCGEKTPVKAKNNPRDKINERKDIEDGCGPCGTVSNHLNDKIPDNGEYEWAGEGGGCHYSSRHPGHMATCSSGFWGPWNKLSSSIVGCKGQYQRKKYLAPDKDCCAGKATPQGTIGSKTCNPETKNPLSDRCLPYTKENCKGAKLFNDDVCKTICTKDEAKADCAVKKTSYCNTVDRLKDKNDQNCYNWCYDNPKGCGSAIRDYCKGKDDLFNSTLCTQYCSVNNDWCETEKQNFCSHGDKIKTDSKCHSWCQNNLIQCKTGIEEYCKMGNNLFHAPICADYCSTSEGKPWCISQKASYCNTQEHVAESDCLEFCGKNFGKCDNAMLQFCKVSKDSDLCACINSKVNKFNPLCVDTPCSITGYATHSMLESKGDSCNIVDCNQYVNVKDLIAGGDITVTPSFMMKCSSIFTNDEAEKINKNTKDMEKEIAEKQKKQQSSGSNKSSNSSSSSNSNSSNNSNSSSSSSSNSVSNDEKTDNSWTNTFKSFYSSEKTQDNSDGKKNESSGTGWLFFGFGLMILFFIGMVILIKNVGNDDKPAPAAPAVKSQTEGDSGKTTNQE